MVEKSYFRNHEGSHYYAMPHVWKKMYVPVLGEVMFIIDIFVYDTPPGKYPHKKESFLSLVRFSSRPITKNRDMPYGSKETSIGD